MRVNSSQTSQYILSALNCPLISREDELELARRWRDQRDPAAREQILAANLRHVVAIARRFRPHNATFDELVAEGSLGLLHALDKFDPERELRFITYAAYWVRTYILTHLLRCQSLLNIGAHSKLLARVRRERRRVNGALDGEETTAFIAQSLAVTPEKVRALLERLDVREVSLTIHPDDAHGSHEGETIASPGMTAEELVVSLETGTRVRGAVSEALDILDHRERYIIEKRAMADAEEELSLAEIARQLGISRERARQLEMRAKRKLRKGLACVRAERSFESYAA